MELGALGPHRVGISRAGVREEGNARAGKMGGVGQLPSLRPV